MVTGAKRSLANGARPAAHTSGSALRYPRDVEDGRSTNRGAYLRTRFRDAVGSIIEDGRRNKMKKQLIEGMTNFNLEGYRTSPDELKKMNKKTRLFYEEQNRRLDDWLEVDMVVTNIADDIIESFDPHDEDGDGIPERNGPLQITAEDIEPYLPEYERDARRKAERNNKYAININVIANICLLAAKIVAALFSSSLSLIASLVDSALDLLCTLIIWITSFLVRRRLSVLSTRFPIGRRRLEPIGILVFSIIMVVSFLQILQESVKRILPGSPREVTNLPATAVFAMLATIIVKGIIWIGCARIKTTQVQALAQDCKTDVIFNSLSLLFPFIGSQAGIWWLDPVGAGLISLHIIYDWASTSLENVARLTGVSAPNHTYKKVLYLAWRFSPIVDSYKNLVVYHAGDGVWVEVDLLLDEKTPLEHAHDLAETLQYCLEGLPEVDRAFVTCDYASAGPSGHAPN